MNTTTDPPPESSSPARRRAISWWAWSRSLRTTLRVFSRLLLLIVALLLLWNTLPSLLGFLVHPLFGLTFFVILLIAVHLFLFLAFLFYIIYSFARTAITWNEPGMFGMTLADYHGNDAVMANARELVGLLTQPGRIQPHDHRVIRGVILVGPPGSGKRALAQAIAHEANVPAGYLNARSLKAGWFGTDNLKVRMLYRQAYRLAHTHGACVLFIEELDVLDNGTTMSNPLHEIMIQMESPATVTTVWNGFKRLLGIRVRRASVPYVLTIAATTTHTLDESLLEPGRFDRCITLSSLDRASRSRMLEHVLQRICHTPLPIERLAQETDGATAGDLMRIIGVAMTYAHQEKRSALTYRDIRRAWETYHWHTAQPVLLPPHPERRYLAYHEAGHAYLQTVLPHTHTLHPSIITIMRSPSIEKLQPSSLPMQHHSRVMTRADLLHQLQYLLGGRAAEETLLGIQTTAAVEDLSQATKLAAAFIGTYGMQPSLLSAHMPTAAGVETLLQEQYQQARAHITANRHIVTAIAEALLLCHTLTRSDIHDIVRHCARNNESVPALES